MKPRKVVLVFALQFSCCAIHAQNDHQVRSHPRLIMHNAAHAQPLAHVDLVQGAPFDLDGTGITVGIWDPGLVLTTHLDLAPRATVHGGETGAPGSTRDHATFLAGTVGASGQHVPAARGMAPKVNIISWDVKSGDNVELEMTSAGAALQVAVHAWGPHIGWDPVEGFAPHTLFGQYNNDSAGFDRAVAAGLVVVKSAGNDRDDTPSPPPNEPADCYQHGPIAQDCLDPIASAKNVITVGAVDSDTEISTQSSFGPTDYGRIKPDVMAYGGSINTSPARRATSLGTASTTASATRGGTSVSAAVVGGIAALILQQANKLNVTLSPAAVKALLVQTARDVQDGGRATLGPDFASGWGIADAQAAISVLRQGGIQEGELSQVGAANGWQRNFFVPAGLAEVHLTLAWTDPAGEALVNDLDLRLIAPDGTVYTPWILNPASPATAAVRNGGNDSINTVEQVSIVAPMAGVWTAQVTAATLGQAPQKFALAGLLPHSDIVLVMDRSGSMTLPSGTPGISKIQALKNAANGFIDLLDLGGGHRLGLVQFQASPVALTPAFDLQQLAATNAAQAHAAVNSIVAGGNTNIISGVNAAVSQLGAAAPAYPRQAIVLFSDGKHNTPAGSNLSSIMSTVQAGNFRFYSVGFGADVDDEILSDVASANHGLHVNEQGLSPIQLTKYFLTVGALAHDMSIVVDPTYQLASGQSASVPVEVSREDQSVTFAVNWTGQQAGSVQVLIAGPNSKCRIPLVDAGGLRTRSGTTYRLVRVQLPFYCGGASMHEGTWTVSARVGAVAAKNLESVDILVLADSRLKLDAKTELPKAGKHLLLTASLLLDGKPLPKAESTALRAYLRIPAGRSSDSAKEDATRPGALAKQPAAPAARLVEVQLADDGKNGDAKAGDGVFTARVERAGLPEGLLQARVVASFRHGKQKLAREAVTSAYVRR